MYSLDGPSPGFHLKRRPNWASNTDLLYCVRADTHLLSDCRKLDWLTICNPRPSRILICSQTDALVHCIFQYMCNSATKTIKYYTAANPNFNPINPETTEPNFGSNIKNWTSHKSNILSICHWADRFTCWHALNRLTQNKCQNLCQSVQGFRSSKF